VNQVELWFAKIQRDVITRGVFTSVADLARKLQKYIRLRRIGKTISLDLYRPSATHSYLTKSLGQVTRAYWPTLCESLMLH